MPLRYNDISKTSMLTEILGLVDSFIKMGDVHTQKIAQHTGISELEIMILREIQMNHTLTPTKLIKNLKLSQYRIKTTLDSLMEKNLIVKVRDESDKRAWAIGLSEDGNKLLESSAIIRGKLVENFSHLPMSQQLQILGSLHQLAEMMKI